MTHFAEIGGKHGNPYIHNPYFRTNNIDIVRNCQCYLGFNLPSDLWPNRVKRFDVKYATSGCSFVNYGFTSLRL